jgi:hypothetical protein
VGTAGEDTKHRSDCIRTSGGQQSDPVTVGYPQALKAASDFHCVIRKIAIADDMSGSFDGGNGSHLRTHEMSEDPLMKEM